MLKKKVKKRSGGICERCNVNPSYAVHHLTYERKYREKLEDLQDVCEPCHKFIHGDGDDDPAETILGHLKGVFMTSRRYVLFFQINEGYLPDDEILFVGWSWDNDRMFLMLSGRSPESEEYFDVRDFIGYSYILKVDKDDQGFTSTTDWFALKPGPDVRKPPRMRDGCFAGHPATCQFGENIFINKTSWISPDAERDGPLLD